MTSAGSDKVDKIAPISVLAAGLFEKKLWRRLIRSDLEQSGLANEDKNERSILIGLIKRTASDCSDRVTERGHSESSGSGIVWTVE